MALLLAVVGLVISAVISARQARLVSAANDRDAQIDQYISRLQAALVTIDDAETGQRGYLLTGKRTYLAPYERAQASAPLVLNGLQAAAVNDAALAADILRVRELASRKLAELAATIRVHDTGHSGAALTLVQSGVGEREMEQIRRSVADGLAILQRQHRAIDSEVVRGTLLSQRFELATVVTLLCCGLFAFLQAGSLWFAHARYERTLSASERQHRAIVEDQTELISISRLDGALEFINPAYSRFFGIPADHLAGRSLYDSLAPAERTEWALGLNLVLDVDEAFTREQFLAASDDHGPRWIAWRHRAQHAPDGVRIHSVGREITLRKTAEEGLRAREDFLARIGRVAGVGGWSVDLRTREVHWSPEVRKIYEVSAQYTPDLEGSLAFFPPRAREKLRLALEDATQRQINWDLELPSMTGNGRKIWVRAVGEVETDAQGTAVRLVGALQDVTQRKAIEQSLRELTEVFDKTPDFIAQTDWRGEMTYLNPAAREAVGIDADVPVAGRTYAEFYTPQTNDRFTLEIIPTVKKRGVWIGETDVVLAGGRVIPISHMVIGHTDAVGRVSRYTSVMRDIGAEVASRQELAKKTSTLNAIVEAIPAVLAVWDGEVRYQLVNKAFERWRGRGRETFLGRTMEEAIGPEEFASSRPWIERALAGETVVYEKDYPGSREYSHMSIAYTPLRREDGSVDGFIGLAQDVTHHRDEQQRLLNLSEHDPLTGLLNRAGFEAYLIEKAGRGEGARLAVLYIDLDHFKPINDKHGHATGDEVLREFGARLQATVRPSDAVARLGGDEFGVVLADIREPGHAANVADKVVQVALLPFEVGRLRLKIGASVGVAYNADLEGGWKGLLARADAKVYEAKGAGRGRRAVGEAQ